MASSRVAALLKKGMAMVMTGFGIESVGSAQSEQRPPRQVSAQGLKHGRILLRQPLQAKVLLDDGAAGGAHALAQVRIVEQRGECIDPLPLAACAQADLAQREYLAIHSRRGHHHRQPRGHVAQHFVTALAVAPIGVGQRHQPDRHAREGG